MRGKVEDGRETGFVVKRRNKGKRRRNGDESV